jgi:hypothetical protein
VTDILTCAYEPCSKEFVPDHWRQRFCSPTCRANQHYVDHPEKGRVLDNGALRCVAGDALNLVRGDAEESDEKARWTLIVREQITRTLMATGYFSVNDLEPLGIPAEHVNVCTSQIGSFASSRYMAKLTWHKSERVSRKGGPYWTFRITEHGREKFPALLEDIRTQLAGLDAGTDCEVRDGRVSGTKTPCVQSGENGVGQRHPDKSDGMPPPGQVAADADSPDHLFDSEAVHITKSSAYSPENEYA